MSDLLLPDDGGEGVREGVKAEEGACRPVHHTLHAVDARHTCCSFPDNNRRVLYSVLIAQKYDVYRRGSDENCARMLKCTAASISYSHHQSLAMQWLKVPSQ